jgi:hypothetical protein
MISCCNCIVLYDAAHVCAVLFKKINVRPFSMPFSVLAVALFSLYAQHRTVFSHLDEDVHFMGQLCTFHRTALYISWDSFVHFMGQLCTFHGAALYISWDSFVHFMGQLCHVHLLKVKMQIV